MDFTFTASHISTAQQPQAARGYQYTLDGTDIDHPYNSFYFFLFFLKIFFNLFIHETQLEVPGRGAGGLGALRATAASAASRCRAVQDAGWLSSHSSGSPEGQIPTSPNIFVVN